MLTPADVINQSDFITASNKALIILYLRRSPLYQLEINFVSSDTASTKIDATQGTVAAQMLNGLLQQLQELGSLYSVEIQRDPEDSLFYSVKKELEEILNQMFYVLYANDPTLVGASPGIVPSAGLYGDIAAVGDRPCYTTSVCNSCGCTPCSASLSTCSGGRKKPRHWLDVTGCN